VGARDKMMKQLVLFFIFGAIAMTVLAKEETFDPGIQLPDLKGVVYFDGFELERVAPLSEKTIEEHHSGARGTYRCEISKLDLLASILEEQGNIDYAVKYKEYNIRAKVLFSKNDVYFIDRYGMARHGSNYMKLDKKRIQEKVKMYKVKKTFK
jgi:hypothetical protein